MSEVVVDASLAVGWVVTEEHSNAARLLLQDWQARTMRRVVPGWFAAEVANVLYRRIRRQELTLQRAQAGLDAILDEVVAVDVGPAHAKRAMELALACGLPASYDALYLALAEERGCEVWTADERFWNSARRTLSWVRWVGEITPM